MRFNTREIREKARKDYDKTWHETGNLVKREGKFFKLEGKGEPHALQELIQRARRVLLDLGFKETCVPIFIDKRDVYAQYGPEAPVILDRVFFLAGLERPDIGIGRRKIAEIEKIAPGVNVEELRRIFREYKEGRISADDLVERMVEELRISEEQATGIISLFPEFREMKPVPTDLTLRSHTTAGWFIVLREAVKREPLPIKLFSVGQKFRREQELDPTHLYDSWTASIVVVAEEISVEDGQKIASEILRRLGFEKIAFRIKKATSRYYAPQTEFEVFVKHPATGEEVEVGDGGMYSPVALSNYDIPYPVFNLGVGLERILMILTGETDIRALAYPYLYRTASFSDQELSSMIRIDVLPLTETGKAIARAIAETARKHGSAPSPCEFVAHRGKMGKKEVLVKLVEPESGTKLVGPAGFNEIYVYDGNVIGLPPEGWKDDEFLKKVRREGIRTGITYMDALASLAARRIEEAAERGEQEVRVRVRNVKSPADINVRIEEAAQRYITSRNRRIDIRGPVFTTVTASLS
ncbi:MAG: O-phosphoserine--tRNA ligase [Candidatus Hadarchaeales archaeon]